ncbi:MAG: hypothetical protein ACK4PI_12135 [Tepidisphaerales bacterium]
MTFRRVTPIGLQLDAACVRAVQLRWSRNGWDVAASADVRLPPGLAADATAHVVGGVLQRCGFIGRDLRLLLDDRCVATDVLEKAPADDEELARCIADALHVSADALQFTAWTAPSLPGRAFVATLPHTAAYDAIRPFERCGFDVTGLFAPMTAVSRLVRVFERPVAVLRCGEAANSLTLAETGSVIYHRLLDTPGGLRPDNRRGLVRLLEEVQDTLTCVPRSFGGITVQRVLVSGELAEPPALDSLLAATPLQLQPLARCASAELAMRLMEALPSRFDLALGLALLEEEA